MDYFCDSFFFLESVFGVSIKIIFIDPQSRLNQSYVELRSDYELKIGINLSIDNDRDYKAALIKQLKIFEEVKFDNVEISPNCSGIIKNGSLDKRECSNLLNILSSYRFSYTVHAPDEMNLVSPLLLKISEKVMKSCIDLCVMLDADVLVVHSGYITPADKMSEPEALRILVGSLKKWGRYARDSGVLIGVENGDPCPTHLCKEVDKLIDVVRNVNMDSVGITFDVGHAFLSASYYKFNFLEAVRNVVSYMIHVHLHDNFGEFDPLSPGKKNITFGYGDLHMPIGWGKIPYKEVFRLIKEGYKRELYLLEIDPKFKEYYGYAVAKLKEMLSS